MLFWLRKKYRIPTTICAIFPLARWAIFPVRQLLLPTAAITEEKKILTPLAKPALRLNKVVEQSKYLALNPGQAISKGVEETIKNPITASTNIAGKITMVTDPLGTGAIPIGLIGTSSEIALKKKFPKYAKITKNLGDKYHKSKGSKYVEGISNGIINGIKGVI